MSSCLNTNVIGGASKILKYFIDNFSPKNIITYNDLRFSSLDVNLSIYSKLGFKFIGYSDPNYKYVDPSTYRLYSRQAFQKYRLSKFLQNYNPNLSEQENASMNGYIQQYDCGNYKFLMELKDGNS